MTLSVLMVQGGVRDLLYGPSVNYLGRKVEPAPSGKARPAS